MKQVNYGIKIEMEHKGTFHKIKQMYKKTGKFPSDTMIAKMISADHLKEDPKYYYKVKKYKL